VPLYKNTTDGWSHNGGDFEWKVGEWTPRIEECKIWERGYYLTNKPYKRYKWGGEVWEAEARDIVEWNDDECVCKQARITKLIPKPDWLCMAEQFVMDIPNTFFFSMCRPPKKEWRLFLADNWAAAWNAASDAARDAATSFEWNDALHAMKDAGLYAQMLVCDDLNINKLHRQHIIDRWDVWQRGYGLLCDVDGVLYVYGVRR